MIRLSRQKIRDTRKIIKEARTEEEKRLILMDLLNLTQFISRRKQFNVGDVPIHCELYPGTKKDDPVIIFLPGIGTYSEMYCEFLSKLSAWGFNVIGVDIRGHGYSGGPRGEYTVSQVISDMYGVLDKVSESFKGPIGFFGCSIGAPLALACAEHDPRISALMCHTLYLTEYPPDFFTFSGWNILRFSRIFMPDFKIDFRSFIDVDSLIHGHVFSDFIDFDTLIVWEYSIRTLSDVYSVKTRLLDKKMDFKSAIITGEHDEVISPEYMRYIISKMKHPFDFITIPGARHMIPFLNIRETVITAKDWFANALRK